MTSTLNRASIRRHGLDWSRMGAARGIAGSRAPEVEGCFLAADEWDADCFVRMDNTGGPVDVWEVSGVDADDLPEFSGHPYLLARIHRGQLCLVRADRSPRTGSSSWPVPRPASGGA